MGSYWGGWGGALVFIGRYHARVWLPNIDPILGFWVDSKNRPKQGFFKFRKKIIP